MIQQHDIRSILVVLAEGQTSRVTRHCESDMTLSPLRKSDYICNNQPQHAYGIALIPIFFPGAIFPENVDWTSDLGIMAGGLEDQCDEASMRTATAVPFRSSNKQPDFKAQCSLVQEVIENRGHLCIFLPKYHCELFWDADLQSSETSEITVITHSKASKIVCLQPMPLSASLQSESGNTGCIAGWMLTGMD